MLNYKVLGKVFLMVCTGITSIEWEMPFSLFLIAKIAVGHQTYYKQIMETTNKLDVIRTLLTIPQATPKQLTRYLSAAVVLWNPSGKRNTKSTCWWIRGFCHERIPITIIQLVITCVTCWQHSTLNMASVEQNIWIISKLPLLKQIGYTV